MITVNNLSKHFGGIKAVDGVDLHIDRGSITGLEDQMVQVKLQCLILLLDFISQQKAKSY